MALILVVTATFSAASAFTTATLDRDAVINVNTDSNSMINLQAGDTDAVYENSNGHLSITMDSSTNSGIFGVNPAASFTFGDAATLNTSKAESSYVYAFNMTVDDAVTGDGTMTLSYGLSDSNGDDNVKYKVYKAAADGGNLLATATDENSDSFPVTKGVTYYVVIEIDTGAGTAADLTNGDSLGGTLTISIQ